IEMSLLVLLLLLAVCQQVLMVEPVEPHEKLLNPRKRRLSLQNTAEIQNCLMSSGDVGCATFQCFSNNSCEIQGLHHICHTLLHNAGSYDSQGKWLVKEALRCAALGLRQRSSCVSRRCGAVGAMLSSLLRECFTKHRLCLALRDHPHTVGDLVHFHLLTPPGPYVELVNFLLGCGEEVRSWVSGRLRAQCSQQWGSSVCAAIGSTCPFNQSDLTLQPATVPPRTVPQPITQLTHRSGQRHGVIGQHRVRVSLILNPDTLGEISGQTGPRQQTDRQTDSQTSVQLAKGHALMTLQQMVGNIGSYYLY
uniref:Stanniocalcin n=1 Tax=Gadus morhua TaxID=8049 RepID=A0A8C5AYI9_GADMO